jgi:hypothetical protein
VVIIFGNFHLPSKITMSYFRRPVKSHKNNTTLFSTYFPVHKKYPTLHHSSLLATNGGSMKTTLPTLHYSQDKWRLPTHLRFGNTPSVDKIFPNPDLGPSDPNLRLCWRTSGACSSGFRPLLPHCLRMSATHRALGPLPRPQRRKQLPQRGMQPPHRGRTNAATEA